MLLVCIWCGLRGCTSNKTCKVLRVKTFSDVEEIEPWVWSDPFLEQEPISGAAWTIKDEADMPVMDWGGECIDIGLDACDIGDNGIDNVGVVLDEGITDETGKTTLLFEVTTCIGQEGNDTTHCMCLDFKCINKFVYEDYCPSNTTCLEM